MYPKKQITSYRITNKIKKFLLSITCAKKRKKKQKVNINISLIFDNCYNIYI